MAKVTAVNTTFSHCSEVISTGNIVAKGDVNITQSVAGPDILDKKAQRIMERTVARIKSWTKNTVRTAALETVLEKLHTGISWITIIGSPGEGKTTTAYMALDELHKKGRQVFQLWSPGEYSEVTLSCSSPIIMLDDIFGDLDFEQAKLEAWKSVLHQILDLKDHTVQEETTCEDDNRIIVIMVGRDYILKAAAHHVGRLASFVCLKVIDMSHPVLRSNSEKINIWNSLVRGTGIDLKETEILELCNIDSGHGFPHVCRMFADLHTSDKKQSAIDFFQSPLQFLNQTIIKLMENEQTLHLFKEIIKRNGKVIKRELENSAKGYTLISTADALVGSYLRKEGDSYMFDHPSVYDSVAYNICLTSPLFVLQNCDTSFIHQRIRVGPPEQKSLHLVVHISDCYVADMLKRFVDETAKGNLLHVFSHVACSEKTFLEHLMAQITMPLAHLLRMNDQNTKQSFLELIPSNKSRHLLKFIDGKTDAIKDNRRAIQFVLLGVSKYAASDVLMYMMDEYDELDVNVAYTYRQETPLMLAAATEDSEFVNLMMTLKPNLLAEDWNGKNAFTYLCQHGHVSAVRQAIHEGMHDDVIEQALFLTIRRKKLDVIRVLMDNLFRTTLTATMDTDKALYLALVHCDEDVIRLLIEHGTSVHKESGIGLTPLHYLCEMNSFKVVKSDVMRGCSVQVLDETDANSLNDSEKMAYKKCVDVLLNAGADVNARSEYGVTPLHKATSSGFTESVDILIKAGADVNAQDDDGSAPLHRAAQRGYLMRINMLLMAGANVNMGTKNGSTPLHEAADGGYANCVQALINSGANVNEKDADGYTPLHRTTCGGYEDCVEILVKAGSDVNTQTDTGSTPLHEAARKGYGKCLDILLKAGGHVNIKDGEGSTPLHQAGHKCHANCVSVLLEKKAAINVQDNNGYTPVQKAATKGYTRSVDLLLKSGGVLSTECETGTSPLSEVAARQYTKLLAIMKFHGKVY